MKSFAALCCDRDILLVNPGSCSVFSGRTGTPGCEEDGHDPVNVYGDYRSLGEKFVVESGCRHGIIGDDRRRSVRYVPFQSRRFSVSAECAAKALALMYSTGRINEKIEIKEVEIDDFLAPADRPLYNVLDKKKYSAFTGSPAPHWESVF